MASTLRIVMAQLNMLVGDIEGNAEQVITAARRARDEFQADAIVFPELTLSGYPPEDLLLRAGLHNRVLAALEQVNQEVSGIDLVLGYPHAASHGLYNAASLLRDGHTVATYHKHHLPNYSVFDEKRYFAEGREPCVVEIKGVKVGITICEDVWHPGPVALAAEAGAQLILNLNASPFHTGKELEREEVMEERVEDVHLPIIYVNQVGGQDELVFDGRSFVMDCDGQVLQRAPAFEEGLYLVELDFDGEALTPRLGDMAPILGDEAAVYQALVVGVRDYIEKNGFRGVVLGLSGGIDSALTLAIAVDARAGRGGDDALALYRRYECQRCRGGGKDPRC